MAQWMLATDFAGTNAPTYDFVFVSHLRHAATSTAKNHRRKEPRCTRALAVSESAAESSDERTFNLARLATEPTPASLPRVIEARFRPQL